MRHYGPATCVAELWRLEQGALDRARQTITRLQSRAADDSPQSLAINTICATILSAMLAGATGQPDAATALDRLDSLLATGPGGLRIGPAVAFTLSPAFVRTVIGISPIGFEDFANLIVARLQERQCDQRAALAAVRRREYAYHRIEYLASHLRQEVRLAALTGDSAGAIRAYQHYLALRSNPEPVLKHEVEQGLAGPARAVGGGGEESRA